MVIAIEKPQGQSNVSSVKTNLKSIYAAQGSLRPVTPQNNGEHNPISSSAFLLVLSYCAADEPLLAVLPASGQSDRLLTID